MKLKGIIDKEKSAFYFVLANKRLTIGVLLFFLIVSLYVRNCKSVKDDFNESEKKESVSPEKQQEYVKQKKDSVDSIIDTMSVANKRQRAKQIYDRRHPKL